MVVFGYFYFSNKSPQAGARSWGWGTFTDAMPAAFADWMPKSVSSKTRQSSGGMPSLVAASRKGSGWGLLWM